MERLFSLTGRICSPTRSNLKPEMVNKLACMSLWLREEFGYDISSRKARSTSTCTRFVTLSVNLVLVSPAIEEQEEENFSDVE